MKSTRVSERPRIAGIVVAVALVLALGSPGCKTEQQLAPPPDTEGCGDDICQPDEHPGICPVDCELDVCGNHTCELYEDSNNCPQDCPDGTICGNDDCEPGEDPVSCSRDCQWQECGNGACEPDETTGSCPQDCFSGYCGNGVCESLEVSSDCPEDCPPTIEADLLFVIDNSGGMLEAQAQLVASFPALYQEASSTFGQPPDLHIGVVSTDLGTAPYPISGCESVGGDAGDLLDVQGVLVGGAPYLIDVRPESCDEARGPEGLCAETDCTPAHCDHEPDTELVLDAVGCPRCRNFGGSLPEAFASLAALGADGCSFSQPLEAMYLALNENPHNEGFVRGSAQLTVVLLGNGDDCSAESSALFDDTQTGLSSPLGPLTSFRCFEFGVTCDVNNRTAVGVRRDCVARQDPGALLYPVNRYTTLLEGLKGANPGKLVVSAITGPVIDDTVEIGLDHSGYPTVELSCNVGDIHAPPAVRLRDFVRHFNGPYAMAHWAFQPICDLDGYDLPLGQVGMTLWQRFAY